MKKGIIVCLIAVLCIIVLLLPISQTRSISGNGTVLNGETEILGECAIDIQVKELKSLVYCYKMHFSFAIDGQTCYDTETFRQPIAVSVSEDGDCLISQMYYDAQANHMKPCELFYRGDQSYAKIFWNDSTYILNIQ